MNWLLSEMDDPDIVAPISQGGQSVVDQSKVDMLISFGFQEDIAQIALKVSGGDIEKATDWIFSNPDASVSSDMGAITSDSFPSAIDAGLPDGGGRYRLIGIVPSDNNSSPGWIPLLRMAIHRMRSQLEAQGARLVMPTLVIVNATVAGII